MNNKYPHFNFDIWLYNFMFLKEYFTEDFKNFTKVYDYYPSDELNDWKEEFYNQNHSNSEDTWDMSTNYGILLKEFNDFMRILMNDDPISLEDCVIFLLQCRFPEISAPRIIFRNLKRGYSYNTAQNNRWDIGKSDIKFKVDILDNVKYILDKLKINYE